MKNDCDIIRDLLPLYAEELTNKTTNRYVSEHLLECKACRDELLEMTKETKLPPDKTDYENLKKAKMRDRKNTIVGVVAVVLALALAFLIAKPYLAYLYMGDRITLSVEGKIDGKSAHIDSGSAVCRTEKINQDIHFSDSEPGKLSTAGNEYGVYTFSIPADDRKIIVRLKHTNWWQIDNCKLIFDINTKSGNMTYAFTDTTGSTELGTSHTQGKTYAVNFML